MVSRTEVAKKIIKALRDGHVPECGLKEILVGRDMEIKILEEEMNYVCAGTGSFKFIKGDYGMGKTLLVRALREVAWKKNFIVSTVEVGRDLKFNKMEDLYSKIVDGMRTRNYGDIPAFTFILQDWLTELEKKIRSFENLNILSQKDREKLYHLMGNEIEKILTNSGAYNASFANAIRGYYQASREGKKEIQNAAIGWLKGEKNIPYSLKQQFNVKGDIDSSNVIGFLQALVYLLLGIEYSGLVVIVDEAELIREVLGRKDYRNTAYENIRKIIDSTISGEFKHVFFVFTATEKFFEDEVRGVRSYEALYQRIRTINEGRYRNLRAPIIELDGLGKEELIELSVRLRKLHGEAYCWEPSEKITDNFIRKYVEFHTTRFDEAVKVIPREYIKLFIDILDKSQQYSEYVPERELKNSIKEVANKLEETKERRDGHAI